MAFPNPLDNKIDIAIPFPEGENEPAPEPKIYPLYGSCEFFNEDDNNAAYSREFSIFHRGKNILLVEERLIYQGLLQYINYYYYNKISGSLRTKYYGRSKVVTTGFYLNGENEAYFTIKSNGFTSVEKQVHTNKGETRTISFYYAHMKYRELKLRPDRGYRREIFFSPSGHPARRTVLKKDSRSVQESYYRGRQTTGVFSFFRANGEQYCTAGFKDGKPHGIVAYYNLEGRLSHQFMFREGSLEKAVEFSWYPGGRLEQVYTCRKPFSYSQEMVGKLLSLYYGLGDGDPRFDLPRLAAKKECRMYSNSSQDLLCKGTYLINGVKDGIWWYAPDKNHRRERKEGYIEGVNIPEQYYSNPELLKPEDLLREKNINRRRIYFKLMGYARFLSLMNSRKVDSFGDYELRKIIISVEDEPLMLLKVKCASTGLFYTLRVPPDVRTCQEALAWTFHVNTEEYELDEES